MELPKIKNENLPDKLKDILGDVDAEFEPIVDPADIVNIKLDIDQFYEGRKKVSELLIQSRKRQAEYHEMMRKMQREIDMKEESIDHEVEEPEIPEN